MQSVVTVSLYTDSVFFAEIVILLNGGNIPNALWTIKN